ncbi:UPF0728 protein C10orf53 homolog isoform X3 [Gopherus flavomarginatus]|uniref:UPF0728 protein C10orf53 homolog isoform X3 n=1 Tax=Gopherus flavomarginatus TaxID=286002 RepID=UPI0021CBB522|nr:UPF0728 protein C10orf53 homolog isoform X3 [Gopherus flavomarginatus]
MCDAQSLTGCVCVGPARRACQPRCHLQTEPDAQPALALRQKLGCSQRPASVRQVTGPADLHTPPLGTGARAPHSRDPQFPALATARRGGCRWGRGSAPAMPALVTLRFGPYRSCGVLEHRPFRLQGLQAVLQAEGHQLILEKIPDWNNVELIVNGETVFECNINDLDFGVKDFSFVV